MRIPSRREALTDVEIKALAQPTAARRRAARIISLHESMKPLDECATSLLV